MANPGTRVYAPAPMKLAPLAFAAALSAVGLAACQPQIGDACRTGLDCSATAARLCDRTQPHGYCTVPACEKGTCPDEAVCVLFRPTEPRLSASYCMYQCDNSTDCRDDQDYWCLGEDDFGRPGEMEARVLDGSKKRFCARRALPLETLPDAGVDATMLMSMDDAAVSGAAGDAAVGDAAMGDAAAGN